MYVQRIFKPWVNYVVLSLVLPEQLESPTPNRVFTVACLNLSFAFSHDCRSNQKNGTEFAPPVEEQNVRHLIQVPVLFYIHLVFKDLQNAADNLNFAKIVAAE